MAKHAQSVAGVTDKVREIDVGPASKPFLTIKLANGFILTVGAQLVVNFIAQLILGQMSLSDVPTLGVVCAIYGFAAVIAWRNLGVLHAIVQPLTLTSLIVLFLGAMIFSLMLGLMGFNWDNVTEAVPALVSMLLYVMSAFIALFAIFGVISARGKKIDALDLKLKPLLSTLERHQKSVGDRKHVPAKNPALGILFLLLGFAWLLGLQLLSHSIAYDSEFQRISEFWLVGCVLLVYSRSYFQPEAKKLLIVDTRPPILFLRSFVDDNKRAYLLDRDSLLGDSLESRLGGYFGHIGPFIAVGSPKEKAPQIGAARARLSDDEWQQAVLGWMDSARYVVMIAGATHWVEWELSNVVKHNRVDSLILLFPQVNKWFGKRKDAEQRLERTRQAFAGTVWSAGLNEPVKHPEHVRGFIFDPDGQVSLTTAKPRNRNTYHLAALVAHYLILKRRGEI